MHLSVLSLSSAIKFSHTHDTEEPNEWNVEQMEPGTIEVTLSIYVKVKGR
jgi:hypothetical protein